MMICLVVNYFYSLNKQGEEIRTLFIHIFFLFFGFPLSVVGGHSRSHIHHYKGQELMSHHLICLGMVETKEKKAFQLFSKMSLVRRLFPCQCNWTLAGNDKSSINDFHGGNKNLFVFFPKKKKEVIINASRYKLNTIINMYFTFMCECFASLIIKKKVGRESPSCGKTLSRPRLCCI